MQWAGRIIVAAILIAAVVGGSAMLIAGQRPQVLATRESAGLVQTVDAKSQPPASKEAQAAEQLPKQDVAGIPLTEDTVVPATLESLFQAPLAEPLQGAAPLLADTATAGKRVANAVNPIAPDIVWGINGHPFTAYPGITLKQQLDALQQLGITHYRVNLPTDGSIYLLDQLVELASQRGMQIVPILAADISLDRDSPEHIYARAFEIARTLARRYAAKIKVWELGNELENYAIIQPCEMRDDGTKYPCEWGPAGGVYELEYFGPRWKKVSAVLHGFSDGVRAGDPTALRAAGTAGWGHVGAFDRMLKDKIAWEISVWHQYTSDQEWALERIAALGKPIWITEFNNAGGSAQGDAVQAEALTKMMLRHRETRTLYGVQAVFIYELFDEPYWEGAEAVMGLVRLKPGRGRAWSPGEPKPAFEAVRAVIAAGVGTTP